MVKHNDKIYHNINNKRIIAVKLQIMLNSTISYHENI